MYMSILNEGIYYIGWVRYVWFLLPWLYAEENNKIFSCSPGICALFHIQ